MALVRYSDTILVNRLNLADPDIAYQGVVVRVFDGDNEEQLYADVDGIAGSDIPYAITDENGLYAFWVESGSYVFRYSFGGTILGTEPVTIYDIGGLVAALGPFSVDVDGLATGIKALNIATSVTNTLFSRSSANISGGTMLYSATPDFATPKPIELNASKILLNAREGVQILPQTGTINKALDIVQNAPLSGSYAGIVALNQMDITWRATVTGSGGLPGLPNSASIYGFGVNMLVGGDDFDGTQAFAAAFAINHDQNDTSSSDKVGGSFGAFSQATSPGILFGSSTSVTAVSGSSSPQHVGMEADMIILGTGTTLRRFGFMANNQGEKRATDVDAAYGIQSSGPAGTADGSFAMGIALINDEGNLPVALAPGARMIYADHALDFSNFIDLPTASISGYILNFANVKLSASGELELLDTGAAAISIGDVASASTFLNIAPATTARASMRIQPGVAQTVPIAGNIYSTGTHLYWVDAGGTPRQLDN